jgi:hypothetical protein
VGELGELTRKPRQERPGRALPRRSLARASAKDRSPPNRAVHRRGLERRVCTVEPPFIGPRVIDRRPQSDVIGAGLRLATGEAA